MRPAYILPLEEGELLCNLAPVVMAANLRPLFQRITEMVSGVESVSPASQFRQGQQGVGHYALQRVLPAPSAPEPFFGSSD